MIVGHGMMARIGIDIQDKIAEIVVASNFFALGVFLKQASPSPIHLIESLGVGIEHIGERLRKFSSSVNIFGRQLLFSLYAQGQVKMVRKQAVTVQICHRNEVFLNQVQEIEI